MDGLSDNVDGSYIDKRNLLLSINKLFEKIKESNEQGRLLCSTCKEDLTENNDRYTHECLGPVPDELFF